MEIICDSRETRSEIPMLLESKGVIVKIETLKTGDYILPNNVLCTRKSYRDLFNSRNSGHLNDEVYRLMEENKDSIIFCIVEKDVFNTRDEIAIASKMIKTMQFVLPTLHSKDRDETSDILIYYAKKAENNDIKYFRRKVVLIDDINPVKKLYMSFGGVSHKTADLLYENFPVPQSLFVAVLSTFQYDEQRWKTKKKWREERWDAKIKFIGEKKNLAIGNLLKGVYEK